MNQHSHDVLMIKLEYGFSECIWVSRTVGSRFLTIAMDLAPCLFSQRPKLSLSVCWSFTDFLSYPLPQALAVSSPLSVSALSP
jgi:hypothetical protein